jgi:hypothetical protein
LRTFLVSRSASSAQCPVGVAQQDYRLPEPVNHRRDILELPFYGVVLRVAVGAATAPIDGAGAEVLLERWQDRSPAAVVDPRPVDQHERRSFAAVPVGDGRAVFGGNTLLLRHDVLLRNPPSSGRVITLSTDGHDATRPSPLPNSENSVMTKFAESI